MTIVAWRRVLVFSLLVLCAREAMAETSNEILAAGYIFQRASPVDGVFEGCTKDRQIRLKDATVFDCGEHYLHYAFEPEARIYRDSLGLNWVFAVDGHAYRGTILHLGDEATNVRRPTADEIGVVIKSHAGAVPYPPNPPLAPVSVVPATPGIQPLTIAQPARPVISPPNQR